MSNSTINYSCTFFKRLNPTILIILTHENQQCRYLTDNADNVNPASITIPSTDYNLFCEIGVKNYFKTYCIIRNYQSKCPTRLLFFFEKLSSR